MTSLKNSFLVSERLLAAQNMIPRIRFHPRRVTEEKCTSIKLETGGFSRGLPVPSRVGQINALSIWVLTNGGPSTDEDRMRSSPKDTSVTGGSAKNATHHIAFVRTVKQILSCGSKHSQRLLIIATEPLKSGDH
jgi:hypothetical protein